MTRVHAAPAAPSATALPASPVTRRSSEPQLCPGSAPKPHGESDKGPYSSPSHTLCKASPSPSLSSYSDPDSGHYCQLQPPARGSREWAAAEASSRQARSYGEKLKELSENGAPEGDWGRTFTVPVVEATSSFNPATFRSLLIPKDNRPLEVGLLRKVKELLAEVDARTLARHVTKVDCLVGAGCTLGQGFTSILWLWGRGQGGEELAPTSPSRAVVLDSDFMAALYLLCDLTNHFTSLGSHFLLEKKKGKS